MKKNIIKYFLAASVLFSLGGCNDFLTETNPSEVQKDVYWSNLNDCTTGLTAVYNDFAASSVWEIAAENNRSDLVWPGYGRPTTTNEYYLQTFTASSTSPDNKWAALYTGIFRANQVIEGLNKIEPNMVSDTDISSWTSLMAQARFFRGLFYFYLNSSFNNGSVVIYDFVPVEENDYFKSLSSTENVKTFFRADLEYAYEHLPAKWSEYDANGVIKTATNAGRVTAGAAASVLGISYLYDKDYVSAITYFNDVINNPNYGYKLVDVSKNMTTDGELNQESILEVVYSLDFKPEESASSATGTSTNTSTIYSNIGGYRSNYPSCWLIMAYKGDSIDVNDSRNVTATDAITGVKTYRKYSLRTSYSIALVDDESLSYYGMRACYQNAFKGGETAYFRKNTNWDITDDEQTLLRKSGINYRVIRLADVYLMYAEALIKGGTDEAGVSEALKYINKVRHRAALQLIGSSMASEYPLANHNEKTYDAMGVMNHLMYTERPLELAGEGYAIRQLDMRRWGITKQRFIDLSKITYHTENYVYYDDSNTKKTKYSCVLQNGAISTTKSNLVDYTGAAQNYLESAHAYWPIPIGEVIANPLLK